MKRSMNFSARRKPARSNERAQHRVGFTNALRYFSTAYRSEGFSRYAATYHLDEACAWLTQFGFRGVLSLKAFCAGAVASNVRTAAFDRFPFDLKFSLGLGAGTYPVAGWRHVLQNG